SVRVPRETLVYCSHALFTNGRPPYRFSTHRQQSLSGRSSGVTAPISWCPRASISAGTTRRDLAGIPLLVLAFRAANIMARRTEYTPVNQGRAGCHAFAATRMKPRSRGERGRESIPPQTHLPRPPTGGVLPAYGTWDRSHNMMVLLLLTEAK